MPNGAVAAVQQEVPPAQSPGVHADADQVSGTTYCGEAREHEGDDHRPGPTLGPIIDFFYSSYFVSVSASLSSPPIDKDSLKIFELI
jgi:hypothetical protein